MIAYCCRESSEKFNFAEYLEDHFGKFAAICYDVLLSVHNFVLLSYLQFFMAHFMVETDNTEGNGDRAYYFLALVNIPLILVSLKGDFKKNKWFCIAMLVAWSYVFIGKLVETAHSCSSEEYWDEFPVNSSNGFGTWVVRLLGLQVYFASAFQAVPFVYKEVKKEKRMNKVINLSSVITLVVYLSVYVFFTFDPASSVVDVEDEEEFAGNSTRLDQDYEVNGNWTSCKENFEYEVINDYGRAVAAACALVINVIPARFALAQLLSGNDSGAMRNLSNSDRLVSAVLIFVSIVVALFMFNRTFWNLVLAVGVALSAFLGVLVPTVATLFSVEYSELFNRPQGDLKGIVKNKRPLLDVSPLCKKIFIYSYLSWSVLLTLLSFLSSIFILFSL